LIRELPPLLASHLVLVLVALFAAIVISLPLAIAVADRPRLAFPIVTVAGVIQTIPGLALLALMVAVVAVTGGLAPPPSPLRAPRRRDRPAAVRDPPDPAQRDHRPARRRSGCRRGGARHGDGARPGAAPRAAAARRPGDRRRHPHRDRVDRRCGDARDARRSG